MKVLWLALPIALVLTGCRNPASGPLLLGRGVPFVLRAPAEGPKFFSTQEVRFQMPDGSEELLVTSVENDAEHMSIVASTPMGQTLFTIQLKQGTALIDQRIPLPKRFDPRLLPALVQLANWPLEDLRKGLEVSTTLEEIGEVRELRRKGRIVLTLRREGQPPCFKKVTMDIPAVSLRATITTLED